MISGIYYLDVHKNRKRAEDNHGHCHDSWSDCLCTFHQCLLCLVVREVVCASIPDSTLDQTVARCVEVDFWGEVALVTFLALMTALACFADEKITELMTLKTLKLMISGIYYLDVHKNRKRAKGNHGHCHDSWSDCLCTFHLCLLCLVVREVVCASIPDSTLDQTVARCVEVDFWGEVALVTFLALMTALACFSDEKITELMTLKTTSLIVIVLSFFSIFWYCYCFYITYSLLFALER